MAGIVAAVAIMPAGCSGGPAIDRPPGTAAATSSTTQPHETSVVAVEPAPPTKTATPVPQTTSTSTTAVPNPTETGDAAPRTINVPDTDDIDGLLGRLDLIIGDLNASLAQTEGDIFDE